MHSNNDIIRTQKKIKINQETGSDLSVFVSTVTWTKNSTFSWISFNV